MARQTSRTAKPTEINRLIAKEMGTDNADLAQQWINAIVKVISDELIMSGSISIRNFGTFKVKEQGGSDRTVYKNGVPTRMYVEPSYSIRFRTSRNFKDIVNGRKLIDATTLKQKYEEKRYKAYEKAKEENDYLLRKKSIEEYQKRWDYIQEEDEMLKQERARENNKCGRIMRRLR